MPGEEERDRLQRLAYEAQVLQSQGRGVQEQLGALSMTLVQIQAASESLKVLKEKAGDSQCLVPIGAGAFAPASIGNGKVLVDIGAGVIVEKTYDEALSILEARGKEMAKAQEEMQRSAKLVNTRLQALDAEARGLVEKMRGQAAPE